MIGAPIAHIGLAQGASVVDDISAALDLASTRSRRGLEERKSLSVNVCSSLFSPMSVAPGRRDERRLTVRERAL